LRPSHRQIIRVIVLVALVLIAYWIARPSKHNITLNLFGATCQGYDMFIFPPRDKISFVPIVEGFEDWQANGAWVRIEFHRPFQPHCQQTAGNCLGMGTSFI
jgi:hypothetical protein